MIKMITDSTSDIDIELGKKLNVEIVPLKVIFKDKEYKDVTLVGLVSHICVISNAIMVKAALPETPIYVDMKATSSVDQSTHQKSIDVMKSLHIDIIQ